jgi:hypothetical protein
LFLLSSVKSTVTNKTGFWCHRKEYPNVLASAQSSMYILSFDDDLSMSDAPNNATECYYRCSVCIGEIQLCNRFFSPAPYCCGDLILQVCRHTAIHRCRQLASIPFQGANLRGLLTTRRIGIRQLYPLHSTLIYRSPRHKELDEQAAAI